MFDDRDTAVCEGAGRHRGVVRRGNRVRSAALPTQEKLARRIAPLLLALLLCWDANTEPDLSHYRIRFAERYIVAWEPCPDPYSYDFCPVYSPFAWAWHVEYGTAWTSPPCGESPGSFCVYRHPTAVDLAGNESEVTPLLWPPPRLASCS